MNILNVVRSLSLVIVIASAVRAEDNKPPKVVSVALERKSQFAYHALAKIDSVNVGEDNSVRLRLTNSTGATVPLGNPTTTCGCVKVVCECKELGDGEKCDLLVQLRPDRKYKSMVWQQTISFASGADQGSPFVSVTITIHAALSGVFVVEPSRLLFVAPDNAEKGKNGPLSNELTVSTTPPVRLENLKIEGGPLLDLFDVNVVQNEKSIHEGRLTLTIDSNSVPKSGIHENLILRDPESGQSREIIISAIRRSPIRVVPATIMVQKDPDSDSWAAFGMIINKKVDQEVDKNDNESRLITVRAGGKKIPVKLLGSSPVFNDFG